MSRVHEQRHIDAAHTPQAQSRGGRVLEAPPPIHALCTFGLRSKTSVANPWLRHGLTGQFFHSLLHVTHKITMLMHARPGLRHRSGGGPFVLCSMLLLRLHTNAMPACGFATGWRRLVHSMLRVHLVIIDACFPGAYAVFPLMPCISPVLTSTDYIFCDFPLLTYPGLPVLTCLVFPVTHASHLLPIAMYAPTV